MVRTLVVCAFAVLAGCSSESAITKDAILQKIDPALRRLVSGQTLGQDRYDMTLTPEGTRKYGVFVDGATEGELRGLGVEMSSAFGKMFVVRVTPDEILRIAALSSVRSLANSTTATPGR